MLTSGLRLHRLGYWSDCRAPINRVIVVNANLVATGDDDGVIKVGTFVLRPGHPYPSSFGTCTHRSSGIPSSKILSGRIPITSTTYPISPTLRIRGN